MSTTSNGGSGAVPSRTPRRPANNNTATFGDESDRSASSSAPQSTLANGTTLSNTNSVRALSKPATTTAQPPFDRGNSIQELKKSLTLDFTNPESAKKSLQTQTPELLSFLRLTSPELEKFLTQGFSQGVSVVQTPTPTQFFFPKNVTVEQEQYARGFLDALNQIYQRSGFIPVNNILSPGFVANTVAQEAKEGGAKDSTGATTSSSVASVFPGPSTSNVSFNAALVSNFLAAISTPTVANNAIPEPAFVTTVSSSGAQSIRQLAAAAAAASAASSSIGSQPTAFYAINPRGAVAFPTGISSNNVLPNISSSSISTIGNESSINTSNQALKPEPDDRCTPSPNTYESRSSSVASSYRDHSSNYAAGSDAAVAATALAAMNRNGSHQYAQSFQTGAGANFIQSGNQQHFLALTNAAQLLIGGQQLDHNLSSTASALSTASSISGSSTKMEIDDSFGGHYLPGTMPLNPEQQEKLKLERKRARNRQAATKCRRRKIERITTLETEVAQLEDRNRGLEDRRDILLDELQELRKLIEEHQHAKCNIVVPTSSQFTGSHMNGAK